ncbi:hypothetical protein ACGK9U_01710 [Mariniflexile sp. HNIBRBA6329]|uniref:hypothetical protein n=1 Tax=Mariniflexile sp. HNIBRBA6329 TaxID=3373088 RepID=UPI0037471CB5
MDYSIVKLNLKKELSALSSLVERTTLTRYNDIFSIDAIKLQTHSNETVKENIRDFFKSFEQPVIYTFELKGCDDFTILNKAFNKAKNTNHEGRAYSKFNDNFPKNEITLYVGSSKGENLTARMINHFGVGSKSVYSMHLKAWLPKDYNYKIQVSLFTPMIPNHNLSFFKVLEVIEQGFWNYQRPLFGKQSGLL